MQFLVCYTIESSNQNSANGDAIMTTPDLSPESIAAIRTWLKKDLRSKGFRAPSVIFTSITKLDEP